jgi:hypothetical protein
VSLSDVELVKAVAVAMVELSAADIKEAQGKTTGVGELTPEQCVRAEQSLELLQVTLWKLNVLAVLVERRMGVLRGAVNGAQYEAKKKSAEERAQRRGMFGERGAK